MSRHPTTRLRSVGAWVAALVLMAACGGASQPPAASSALPGPTAPPTVSPAPTAPPSPPASATVPPSSNDVGTWEGAGTLVWPRQDPTAAVLGDGRVLVVGDAGGKYEGPPEQSRFAEVWSPATGTWRDADNLPSGRDDFGMVTLRDGRVLVAGGWNGGFVSYSSAYVFDGEAGTWTKTGLMVTARTSPAIAVLRDGRVLVAGGGFYTGVPTDGRAQAFDLVRSRSDVGDGRLPSIPLLDTWPGPSGRALATAELFEPRTNRWTATGPMRRAGATAAVTLSDGRVLVAGASAGDTASADFEVYDADAGRFTVVPPPPGPKGEDLAAVGAPATLAAGASMWSVGRVVPLSDGSVLLAASDWGSGDCSILRTLRLQPATGQWSEIGAPYVECAGDVDGEWTVRTYGNRHPDAIVAALPGGRVLLAGGYVDGFGTREAEVLDISSGEWIAQPPMPGARAQAAAVALADGSVLVVGGWSNGGDGSPVGLADTFRFIPATD